jgi:hypothetical protein
MTANLRVSVSVDKFFTILSGRLPRWDQPLVAVSVLKTLCKP